jgi:hypothetical protein
MFSGVRATLIYPVCKLGIDWVNATTKKRVNIGPTHWRKWTEKTRV